MVFLMGSMGPVDGILPMAAIDEVLGARDPRGDLAALFLLEIVAGWIDLAT
jgi:hypothetical protein